MIAIAWAALVLWPFVSIVFYQKMTLPIALCATMIGGYLLLPSELGLDLPVLPPLNKYTIPSLTALVLTMHALGRSDQTAEILRGWIPRNLVTLGLLIMLSVGVVGAVMTNGDTLVYGWRVIPGLKAYDFFSLMLDLGVMLIPFFLARRVLASVEGQRILIWTIAVSALGYSLLALYEVRMSPQLHMKLYGYFPHSFAQHMRQGGFRPLVFLNHGLSLGIYLTFAVLAVAGLTRISREGERIKWGFAILWLMMTLVLAKSLGALLIALALLPLTLFFKLRVQLLAAVAIATIVMVYPTMRAADVVPVDKIMAMAEDISKERAASFNTRIENEEVLLAKARERPLFGWGGWGRNRVFNEDGYDASITDGSWVIEFGTGGWFRYIGVFGLLCWPIIGLVLVRRERVDQLCMVLALILSAKLIDLIPNSGMFPTIWMIAGSLAGRLEMKRATREQEALAAAPDTERRGPVYVRTALEPVVPSQQPTYVRSFPKAQSATSGGPKGSGNLHYVRPKPATRYRK